MNCISQVKEADGDGALYRAQVACPKCSHLDSRVLESRGRFEADRVMRRRKCLGCGHRFTTQEMVLGKQIPTTALLERVARAEKSLAFIQRMVAEIGESVRAAKL